MIAQLDDLLAKYNKLPLISSPFSGTYRHDPTLAMRMQAALDRCSPPNSTYSKDWDKTQGTDGVAKAVRALRDDYASGYMSTLAEIIHADLFSDMLLASEHLLKEGYKDPAAVMVGGVLEQHLRELCAKNDISTDDATGKPKKASQLNQDLKAGVVYGKQELHDVTAWLNLRNDAAHAHYDNYTSEQVQVMIDGVRSFILRYPA